MRKLILICLLCLFVGLVRSATVTYHWNAINNPVTVGGLPAKYLKLSYGPSLGHYTNSITVGLTNLNTTNVYHGWDQYNCVWIDVRNYVEVKVTGLVRSQQIYTAYSIINSNGLESPYINQATCGFTVTNNADAPPRPINFRITLSK
jgi:hypothetical protein